MKKRYEVAQSQSKRHLRDRPYIIPFLGLIIGFFVVIGALIANNGQTIRPSDAHVVFLFDGGKRQVLDSRAKTVGELISKLPLKLIAEDVVEPSQNDQIPEDNFRINVYRARPVTVVVSGGSKVVTLTAQKSPRVVAQKAGLKVYAEDGVSFAQGSLKENIIGEKVVIKRSTPVILNLYGTRIHVRTLAKNIGDFLNEKQIKLAGGDSVQPGRLTPIRPNLQIFILR